MGASEPWDTISPASSNFNTTEGTMKITLVIEGKKGHTAW